MDKTEELLRALVGLHEKLRKSLESEIGILEKSQKTYNDLLNKYQERIDILEDLVKNQKKYISSLEKDTDDLFKIMDQIVDRDAISDDLEKFCPFCFRTARYEASIDHDPYCLISQYRILRKKERLHVPDNQ